jgi:glycosyltransferase involved in cell wall biosynthesis
MTSATEGAITVSVVIPCLNEADTLEACIVKAKEGLAACGETGEIIIADNGSTDRSLEIASSLGVRVVHVPERGYGSALMGGIAASRGRWVIMGDADDSYDFREIPKFVAKLREGHELVQGCRLPSGGGRIMPGAMPFLHRWWGNPMFSAIGHWWFHSEIHDIYCGLRGFARELYGRLGQRCTGMEFATEMIVKAFLVKARICEVPITLYPDGRKAHRPHLQTFRDGWRTLRFLLMYSPRWLFLMPGLALILAGLLAYAIAFPGMTLAGIRFDVHTLLFASLAVICGTQAVGFALMAKKFAVSEGLLPVDARLETVVRFASLERGLVLGAVLVVCGVLLLAGAVYQWASVDFGDLDYSRTMRWVIPGMMFTVLGFQTTLFSFFLSLLGLRRK